MYSFIKSHTFLTTNKYYISEQSRLLHHYHVFIAQLLNATDKIYLLKDMTREGHLVHYCRKLFESLDDSVLY